MDSALIKWKYVQDSNAKLDNSVCELKSDLNTSNLSLQLIFAGKSELDEIVRIQWVGNKYEGLAHSKSTTALITYFIKSAIKIEKPKVSIPTSTNTTRKWGI